ncbi:unnamed protein product [Rhizopus stolonifer]
MPSGNSFWVHDGDSYDYDVSGTFFKYHDETILKAENLKDLDDHEHLTLDEIMLIDNQFYNNDIVNFNNIDGIMDDVESQGYFRQNSLEPPKQTLPSKFAHNMAKKKIETKNILDNIKNYQAGDGDSSILCIILRNLLNTYFPQVYISMNNPTIVCIVKRHLDANDPSVKNANYYNFYTRLSALAADPEKKFQKAVDRFKAYVQISSVHSTSKVADLVEENAFACDEEGQLGYRQHVKYGIPWVKRYNLDIYLVLVSLPCVLLYVFFASTITPNLKNPKMQ